LSKIKVQKRIKKEYIFTKESTQLKSKRRHHVGTLSSNKQFTFSISKMFQIICSKNFTLYQKYQKIPLEINRQLWWNVWIS